MVTIELLSVHATPTQWCSRGGLEDLLQPHSAVIVYVLIGMCAFHFSNSAQSLSFTPSTSARLYVPGGVTDCTRYWPPWVLFCLVTSVYWINNYPLISCTCGCICLWLLSLLAKESRFRYVEGYSCMWSIVMVTIQCLSCTCSCAIADLFHGRRLQWTFLSLVGHNFQWNKWRVVSTNRIVWKSCSSSTITPFYP